MLLGKCLELCFQRLELLVVEAFKVDQARPGGGRGWGQYPTGRIGPVLLIVLILVLIGGFDTLSCNQRLLCAPCRL